MFLRLFHALFYFCTKNEESFEHLSLELQFRLLHNMVDAVNGFIHIFDLVT